MKPRRAGSILLPIAAVMGAKELYDRFKERRDLKAMPLPDVDIVSVYVEDTLVAQPSQMPDRLHDSGSLCFSPQDGAVDDYAQLAKAMRDAAL